MRPPAIAVVFVISLLAGCTSDGYLGEIDESEQRTKAASRAQALWRQPARAHPGDLDVSAPSFSAAGGLAPIFLASARLDPAGAPGLAHLALANVSLDGERGWLVGDANASVTLDVEGAGALRLVDPSLRGDASGLRARLVSDPLGGVMIEFGPCVGPDDARESCRAWRATQPPPRPAAYEDLVEAPFRGIDLPTALRVRGGGLAFHPASGDARAVDGSALVDASGARLVGLAPAPNGTSFPASGALDVPVELRALAWRGNVTLSLDDPSGSLTFPTGSHALDGFRDVRLKIRGEGEAPLSREAASWRIQADDAAFVDVATDGTHRLAATLRLVPDQVEARGPPGNATRIQLLLAETSQGADAHVSGYRIDASTNARYVGFEPFSITADLIEAINDTRGPVTPFAATAIGVALPFVALGEAFVAIAFALFPPSLAGPMGAAEARALTFELEVPATPQDVEILIEAENAEPVRATIRLVPGPAAAP